LRVKGEVCESSLQLHERRFVGGTPELEEQSFCRMLHIVVILAVRGFLITLTCGALRLGSTTAAPSLARGSAAVIVGWNLHGRIDPR